MTARHQSEVEARSTTSEEQRLTPNRRRTRPGRRVAIADATATTRRRAPGVRRHADDVTPSVASGADGTPPRADGDRGRDHRRRIGQGARRAVLATGHQRRRDRTGQQEAGRRQARRLPGVPGADLQGVRRRDRRRRPTSWAGSSPGSPTSSRPEGQQSAFQQALDLAPDAIMSSGQTPSVTLQQRQAAAEAGHPVLRQLGGLRGDPEQATGSVDEDPAPPTLLLEPASFVAFQNGTLPAAWAIAETDGNVHSIFVNVPDIPIIVPPQISYEAALDQACPDTCTNVVLAATVDEIGTTIPEKVVSTLQENPDTNYIVFTSGDFSLGVAAAVQAAGFDDVKLIGATPIQANVESMRSGGPDEAWAGVSNIIIGWRLVDGAVRYFNGDPIPSPVALSPDDTGPAAWPVTRIYTPETAPESADFVEPENYVEIFSELWQLP